MIKINDIYLFNKTQVKSEGLNCTAVFLEVRQMFMHSTSFRTKTPSRAILTSFFFHLIVPFRHDQKTAKKVSQFFVSLIKNLGNFKLNSGPFWIRVLIVRKMRFKEYGLMKQISPNKHFFKLSPASPHPNHSSVFVPF